MAELSGEDKIMLIELLKKAGIPVLFVSCKLERCINCCGNTCTSDIDLEMDDNGNCLSFVPKW